MRHPFLASVAVFLSVTVISTAQSADKSVTPTKTLRPFADNRLDEFTPWLKGQGSKDPKNVFSIKNEVLRISGEGAGYLATKQAYRDYHLSVEYKWDKKTDGSKYVRNSGILIHGVGPDGGARGVWMTSIECQLAQGCEGDLIVIRGKDKAGKTIPATITSKVRVAEDKKTRWDPNGKPMKYRGRQFWWSKHQPFFKELRDTRGKHDVASPLGEWTKVEVLCRGKRITIKINGETVNECYDAFPAAGQILLQNEGNEILFRNLEIRPLKPPNIVVILADDLGYGDLSSYGEKDLKSPHIDALVKSGIRFTNFYANCPVCSPTRAALLTGRYQDMVGVPGVIRTHATNSWGYLHPDAVLLPSLLKKAGYHTAIVGKWHLGLESPNVPNDRGFDFFHGFLGDMMDDYYKHRRHGINYMRRNRETIDPKGHATDLFTDWACDYLRSRQREKEPFFLYLAYNAPHTPIQPPKEWLAKVRKREPNMSPKRAKLVALIEHMDAGIGKVMKTLKETGADKNTLVVFTSDNGGQTNVGANNGPLRDGKQSVYEGGLKVPAAFVWPRKIKPGTTTDFRAMSMDIFPTVLQAAGVKAEHVIDGKSILPTLRGETQSELRTHWFFRRREGGNRYGGKTIEAVIHGDWKLLQNSPFQPLELYNLKTDPKEQHNLAQKNRKVFNQLSAALRKEIQRYGSVPWQKPAAGK